MGTKISDLPSVTNVSNSDTIILNKGDAVASKITIEDLFETQPMDSTPTEGSVKAVTSGGVYEAIENSLNQAAVLELIYPVGSIYMSINNVSPATFIGGTWQAISDMFLLSAGSTYSAGETGGSATHLHANGTLATALNFFSSGATGYIDFMRRTNPLSWKETDRLLITGSRATLQTSRNESGSLCTDVIGDTAEASSLPPYLVVYMWKRVN